MGEIEGYKNKFGSLHHENVELQNMIMELEEANEKLQQEKFRTVDRSKLEELMHHIEDK